MTDLGAYLESEQNALQHALSLVRLVEVNDVTLRLWEVDSKEELLERWTELFTDETFKVFADELQAIWDGRNEVTFQCSARTASGKPIHYEMHWVAPLVNGRMNLGQVIIAIVDVTDHVVLERQLGEAVMEISALKERLEEENIYLREEVRAAHGFKSIIGASKPLQHCLEALEMAAPTNATVLILGETGTGKELFARALHELSDRSDKPLITVNCASLSESLIDSELFGHERGAFTGAHQQRKGRFELAHLGTLFLDEIAELPLQLQAKLLRVIQTGTFERLGGTKTLQVDVRLIVATNRNLENAVARGEFRQDLYYRINTFPIRIPSLRERTEDIPALARHFLRKHARTLGERDKALSARTCRHLQERDWPGNVRELEHFIERALISSDGDIVDYVDQPGAIATIKEQKQASASDEATSRRAHCDPK